MIDLIKNGNSAIKFIEFVEKKSRQVWQSFCQIIINFNSEKANM